MNHSEHSRKVEIQLTNESFAQLRISAQDASRSLEHEAAIRIGDHLVRYSEVNKRGRSLLTRYRSSLGSHQDAKNDFEIEGGN